MTNIQFLFIIEMNSGGVEARSKMIIYNDYKVFSLL